ncbi:MAG: porin family protein [Sphingomonadales bacterium]|nr:porin family protein [Sphingomonadales bacterium]MBU3991571.1 porin family protein [Alphaproteobacteria bacterium]
MKKFTLAAAAIAAALPSSAALAQEAPAFGGLYAGALAGYDHVKISGFGQSESRDGATFGAIVGYDMALSGAIVGVEAEASGSSVKEEVNDYPTVGAAASLKAGRDLYIGVRAGAAVLPSTLVYLKGGYTNARVILNYDDGAGFAFSEADNLDGYRIGAGVEQAFGRLRARLEYRYSDYNEAQYNGVNLGADAKRHQVVVALVGNF